ncbi:Antibiotic biosynthesis monooxygenase [Mesorhizobium alhagi CCNWXJ12-2]|jgi:quinol monooxygenase YgiN|uniref:Antibiotic biosynthesis monooxygenase n=1 Tax=Mesorhizobium alhagi CCNWXJ12-2 TaxID=1107882 RepID=H0HIV4_9HYPH|nr:Antibiotic biosynthesis monooxygenase [Mesorhizobium alhagi CCNWXJ12-2]
MGGGTLVIIIAGYTRAERQKRDAAVEAFAEMARRARKQEGCLDLSISSDSVDPERINIFECWRDQQAWNAWRKIAKAPRVALREAHVKLYRSDKAEEPFSRNPRRRSSSRIGNSQ